MNRELKEEREKVSFNVEELTNWLYGGADNVKEKRFLENYFYTGAESKIDTSYLSHVQKYEEAIRKVGIILQKLKQLTSKGQYGEELYSKILGGTFIKHLIKEGNPISVHFDMFIPAIKSMGTTEQQSEWIPRAAKCEILGTYAQTELGHGTYVRGLETTATFDPVSKQFVLNSPTLTSYKWWPGNLAHTVNYALIMAQLYTNNVHHGVHAFIVQLRDEETHMPMSGIKIGEIGTKLGYNTVNNGFLAFNNVRIPRKNMLMKNSEVTENGDYIVHKNPLLTYGTMTMTRIGIINEVQTFLAKAVVIAIRYSLVRRQSPIDPDKPEPKIIEHITQQYKIFPAMSKAIVMNIAANFMWKFYNDIMKQIDNGDLSRLSELHALSCCLKAICTNDATKDVEICRLSCGGHGYLNSAGFVDIYKMVTPAQTYEGENTVLFLQTARYLLKTWEQALKGSKLSSTVAYLKNHIDSNHKQKESFDSSPRGILRAMQSTAAAKIASAYRHVEEKKKLFSEEESRNLCSIELIRISELHGRVFLLQTAVNELEKASKKSSPHLSYVFKDILELFTVDIAKNYIGDMLQHINISSAASERLQGRLVAVLKRIRQYVIGIADAFDFSDEILDSTLGAFDGNVYERLIEATTHSSLNHQPVNESFEKYLKPFMKSNL
ncbi:acyl-coenzyme A oxidase 1-like [Chironomus tepperi]|uniref:acyl-coenzyme A oxidase 1-like n=1 Tax=Chironomus tepperi TaxID=113505 RepID=UPI00391FAF03